MSLIRNMMMKHVGLKLGRIDSSSGSVQTARRRERDGEKKMKGGERQVWWSGKAECWRERCVQCHLCVCVFVRPCLCEFWGFACFLKRHSPLSLSALTATPSLPLSLFFVCLSLSLRVPLSLCRSTLQSSPTRACWAVGRYVALPLQI